MNKGCNESSEDKTMGKMNHNFYSKHDVETVDVGQFVVADNDGCDNCLQKKP